MELDVEDSSPLRPASARRDQPELGPSRQASGVAAGGPGAGPGGSRSIRLEGVAQRWRWRQLWRWAAHKARGLNPLLFLDWALPVMHPASRGRVA